MSRLSSLIWLDIFSGSSSIAAAELGSVKSLHLVKGVAKSLSVDVGRGSLSLEFTAIDFGKEPAPRSALCFPAFNLTLMHRICNSGQSDKKRNFDSQTEI